MTILKTSSLSNQTMTEHRFLNLLRRTAVHGTPRVDRTGIGTRSVFGADLKFNLRENAFPLLTTRKMSVRPIFEELMWILRGQTNVGILESKGIHIWTPNSTRAFLDQRGLTHYAPGDIGPSYGFQLRHFGATYIDCTTDYTGQGFDQLEYVTHLLRTDPTSRRIVINLWNPTDLTKMALPPCGYGYQFYVEEGELSCKVLQRSSDIMLAGGWNIASASLLTKMLAATTNLTPGDLIWSVGDCHVYENQLTAAVEQLHRRPYNPPTLHVHYLPSRITDFEWECFELVDYQHHGRIQVEMNA